MNIIQTSIYNILYYIFLIKYLELPSSFYILLSQLLYDLWLWVQITIKKVMVDILSDL